MKTQPTGIRIKQDKLDFIKDREGLSTVQQVVTFLVDKYWWENKLVPNRPPEPKNELPPKQPKPPIEAIKLSVFQEYLMEVNEAGSWAALGKIIAAAKKDDGLNAVEKTKVELAGNAKRSELYF